MFRKSVFYCALLMFGLATIANSQTLHVVTNSEDDDVNSLRNVISIAESGDSIFFGSNLKGDTIWIDSSELLISKNITIIGFPDTNLTISTHDSIRIVKISKGSTCRINYVNIIGGTADFGGGIYNEGNLSLFRSRVAHNTAEYGGGIYNDSSTNLFAIETTIERNIANSDGGGVINFGYVIFDRSTINNNEALGLHGGGVSHLMGTAIYINSTLSSNKCRKFGGGIYNSALTDISHTTMVLNDSERGGGLFNVYQKGFLYGSHSLIALNSASVAGPDVHDPNGTDVVSHGYNLIGDISFLTSAIGSTGDIFGFPDNPIDPLIEPLAYNGGFTKTHALICLSPAINKGDSIGNQIVDQRGRNRNYDGKMDIGSFELQEDSCESATGINERDLSSEVSIYPNPNNGRFNISLPEGMEFVNIVVRDLKGLEIQTFDNRTSNQIELTGIPSGTYLIHIKSSNYSFVKKLIINK
ncbi:MAG: T9SS type A sorting domain-containing protein [Chitinophagales bacterium]|nr:T9SS type A sorting domain-containing protein [Chitinophagales bacterium]